jgi:hypothetical protein
LNLLPFPGILWSWTGIGKNRQSKRSSPDAAIWREEFREGPTAVMIRDLEAELREQLRAFEKK